MSKICEIDSSVYRVILAELLNDLPDFRFSNKIPDLSAAITGIKDCLEITLPGTNGKLSDEDRQAFIINEVINTYNSLKKCPEHQCYFNVLDRLADNLGANINNIFTTLATGVKPEVDNLKEQIEALTAQLVSQKAGVIDLNGDIKADYEMTDFKTLYEIFGGADELSDAVKEVFGFKPALTVSSLQILISNDAIRVTNLKLDKSVNDEIFDRLSVDTSFDSGDISRIVSAMCDDLSIRQLTNELVGGLIRGGSYAESYKVIRNALEKYSPIVDALSSLALNVSDIVAERIHANLEKVKNVLLLAGFGLMVMEDNLKHFKILVLSNDLVFADLMEDFKDAKGTPELISKYLKVFYFSKNVAIPSMGVKLDAIVKALPEIEELYTVDATADKLNAERTRRDAMRNAIINVLYNYLLSTPEDKLPKGRNAKAFADDKKLTIRHYAGKIDVSNSDSNLESVLYDFILEIWFKNTPVELAHQLIGKEVIKQLELNPDMSDKTCDLIDTSIGSIIISDFIVTNLLV